MSMLDLDLHGRELFIGPIVPPETECRISPQDVFAVDGLECVGEAADTSDTGTADR